MCVCACVRIESLAEVFRKPPLVSWCSISINRAFQVQREVDFFLDVYVLPGSDLPGVYRNRPVASSTRVRLELRVVHAVGQLLTCTAVQVGYTS